MLQKKRRSNISGVFRQPSQAQPILEALQGRNWFKRLFCPKLPPMKTLLCDHFLFKHQWPVMMRILKNAIVRRYLFALLEAALGPSMLAVWMAADTRAGGKGLVDSSAMGPRSLWETGVG